MSAESGAVRTTFRNDTTKPLTVWIEPWGEDYTLLPNEEFDLYVPGLRHASQVISDQEIQFYIEQSSGEHDHWLTQNGHRLDLGHNRQSEAL